MHSLAKLFGRRAMAVKEIQTDKNADPQVKIVARKGGLVSWLLTFLGIDATYTLWVYRDRIESQEGSLGGKIKTVVPLSALDTCTSGFTKPVHLLAWALAALVCSIVFHINHAVSGKIVLILLALAALWIVAYFLKKCLLLKFTTYGANEITFLFKRSVIEGVAVDETLADKVAGIVKQNYIAQARK